MERLENRLAPRGVGSTGVDQRAKNAHRGKRQLVVANASKVKRLREQGHNLGVGRRALLADALDADLGAFAHVSALTALGFTEDALHIAEAKRAGLVAQARCAHARDLKGDVGAHGNQITLGVEEFERRRRDTTARLHGGQPLKGRRFDRQVAARRKAILNCAFDSFARDCLISKNIAETRRCHKFHFKLSPRLRSDAVIIGGSKEDARTIGRHFAQT